jgi:hypothetical protein
MSTQRITIEIQIESIQSKQMPDEDTLTHQLIEYLHDFRIDDSAYINTVHVTMINGEPTL